MSNERVRVVQLKAWGVGMVCLLTSACMQDPGTPGDGQSVAVEQAAPQSISRHYYGYINPRTGEAKFSTEPFVLGEAELDFGAAGRLVPNQFGEVPLVQNGTSPFNTFQIQGVGASIDDATESAGQTQCPGSNVILDIQMSHFFEKADFDDVFVEFTSIEPGVTHYPYDTDSVPGGLPLDDSIGVYDYGSLSDGNSNQSTRTWKFERCTDEPFIVEFAILGSCVPEAGETALSACMDNPGYKRLMASNAVSCLRSLNGAKCWGDSSFNQLTTGSFEDSATPVTVKKEVANKVSFLTGLGSGARHACSVTNDKRVKCWGNNAHGQLGDETTTNSADGVQVRSPTGSEFVSNIVQVVAGENHSCALSTVGGVRCWGDNGGGQLGTGDKVDRLTPTPTLAPVGTSGDLLGASQIAANYFTTCALLESKEVACWGFNRNGQLGSGSGTVDDVRPVYVQFEGSNLSSIKSISAGTRHVCAVSETGNAYCWGDNRFSQIGDGTSTLRDTAVAVVDEAGTGLLTGVEEIAAGHIHTCARLTSGEARCWGFRFQLGTGSSVSSATPVAVRNSDDTANLTGVTSIQTRYSSTCALTSPGDVMCWGINGSGQLGDDSTSTRLLPVPVMGEDGIGTLSNVSTITVGDEFACALDSVDDFFCWGANSSGQLTTGDFVSSSTPEGTTLDRATLKTPLLGVNSIVGGELHSCVLTDAGEVLCWGDNGGGQLGVGDKVDREYPTPVNAPVGETGVLSGVIQLVGNYFTTCALLDSQEVACWGFNRKGQTGSGTGNFDEVTPAYVVLGAGNLEDVVQISAGHQHVCATTSLGEVFCWGFNRLGQLGDGSITNRPIPVSVRGPGGVGFLTNVVSVHAGNEHSCALIDDGSMYCWGFSGRLGTGATGTSTVPVQVAGIGGAGTLSDVVAVSTFNRHTLALLDDGTLVGWGDNSSGQLGDGTTTSRLAPVKVLNEAGISDLLNVREISAGFDHSCAYMADRTVKCWGAGDDGQLGDGLFTSSLLPVSVTGF